VSDPRERQPIPERDDVARRSESFATGRGDTPSGDELRELRQVVSLLRGLPDPEPPEGLAARVMERVEEIESRPWYGALRSGVAPVIGSALAAGVAGVLFFSALQPGPLESARPIARAEGPAAQRVVRAETVASGAVRRGRRPSPSPLPFAGPHGVSFEQEAPLPVEPLFAPPRARQASAIERSLDHQLNRMLLDPFAFFQRLERVRDPERFVARLANRAAQRGDSAEVGLWLRAFPHRSAQPVSEQFFRAAQVDYAYGR
jgi:hypothetical protein